MTKKLLLIALVLLSFTGIALAQTDSTKGWSAASTEDFVRECIKTATTNIGEDSAKRYCSCMVNVIQSKYPTEKEAEKITSADLAKPEMKKLIQDCLIMKWSDTDRKDFTENCEKTAAALGEAKAKKYCSCMLSKLEIKYAEAKDAAGLTPEELAKPEWKKIIAKCLE